ncbi:hypothetical protein EYD45_02215 [Hyunsoonleella flava]|uniref:Uncharacterized protein n=1 Tax=Hyunsoonleella flava TaxID=2527939 RepID=A0A4Q9FHD8_9FLAO|nr:hypothetical protein [Hyunsoonleella flava]TBN06719.1 hypothetical protein EYD45_02215 [Hyunsoonleella flava]
MQKKLLRINFSRNSSNNFARTTPRSYFKRSSRSLSFGRIQIKLSLDYARRRRHNVGYDVVSVIADIAKAST